MKNCFLISSLIVTFTFQSAFSQSWTKISGIADSIKVKGLAQIDNQVLISGQRWGSTVVNHFTSTDGNTWSKLPTFSFAGDYLFGFKENNFLLGGGFLSCQKLVGNAWSTPFAASGFAEFPNGTIIGGSAGFPDSLFRYSAAGVKGAKLGDFKFKFGPKYCVGSNGRLFLFSYGSGFGYIDQSDMSKIKFPSSLNGTAMTEISWYNYIIDDMVKTSNGTLIATDRLGYGIFRSTDNGETWVTVGTEFGAAATSIAINSKDEIFVIYDAQIRKSTDLGLTFPKISAGLPKGVQTELFLNAKDELFVILNSGGNVKPLISGIFKYSESPLEINSESANETRFKIHPNPAVNTAQITINESFVSAELTIATVLGELVQTQLLSANQSHFNIDQLPKGAYFITLVANGKSKTQKLIMQ